MYLTVAFVVVAFVVLAGLACRWAAQRLGLTADGGSPADLELGAGLYGRADAGQERAFSRKAAERALKRAA